MNYQVRCVDFAYNYKIVATTETVDDTTRIITTVFPIDSTIPNSISSTAFNSYADSDALNAAVNAAIEAQKQNLSPPSTASSTIFSVPDPLSPSSRPSAPISGPSQTTTTPKTDELKPYRQTVGSETPATVARNMMNIISAVKAGQSTYVSPDGTTTWESLKGSFERLLGLKSTEIPEEQLLGSNQRPFVYFIYTLLHDNSVVQSIDGQTDLSGQALIDKLYEVMIKRLQELDGHNLKAIIDAADAIRSTGTQILSTITSAKAGVTPTKQKISDEIAKDVDRATGIINTIESWASTTFSPDEQKDLYKEPAKYGSLDYQKFRFERNDATNVFATTPETASIMQNVSLSSAWLNTDADTMRKNKLDLLTRTLNFSAKHRYYGDVYSVLTEGRGLEEDPNTLTMRMVVAYFAACLKTMKGLCSECRHYRGPNNQSTTSRVINRPSGGASKGVSSCLFGFTNPDNTNKGPDDYCWTDSIAPGRGASGVKYELNSDISNKIRELAMNLAKG